MGKVVFRTGARVKAPLDAATAELERVREMGGGAIDLQRLVDESKAEGAVFHDDFEWDDERAGNSWQLQQARKIVSSVVVVDDARPITRVYKAAEIVTEPSESPRFAYQRTEDLLASDAGRAELLGRAISEATAFRKRYAALSELAVVIAAIDRVVEAS